MDQAENSISVALTDRGSLLVLESRLREVLQCSGAQCAFTQSVQYAELKHSVLLRLAKVVTHDAAIRAHIPNTGLVLSVDEDADGALTATISKYAVAESPWQDGVRRKAGGQSKFGRFERQLFCQRGR